MAATSRGKQINFEISDARLARALQQIAIVREISLPDLMRELVRTYVDGELAGDVDLRAAVDSLERAVASRTPADATVTVISDQKARDRRGST
jgi:hypothetical protein